MAFAKVQHPNAFTNYKITGDATSWIKTVTKAYTGQPVTEEMSGEIAKQTAMEHSRFLTYVGEMRRTIVLAPAFAVDLELELMVQNRIRGFLNAWSDDVRSLQQFVHGRFLEETVLMLALTGDCGEKLSVKTWKGCE